MEPGEVRDVERTTNQDPNLSVSFGCPIMIPVKDRQAALEARFTPWTPLTLHGSLDVASERFGDRPFLITDDRTWTYADMVGWSERIAMSLRARGIRPGDKVSVVLGNYPEFAALKFGLSRVGAVAIPINILNRRDELRYLLEQSDSVLLITMDRFRDIDYLEALDQIAPNWPEHGGGSSLPKLREVIVFPTAESPVRSGLTFFDVLNHPAGAVDLPSVSPFADCDIIYTSGTTGQPKGVMLTHDMLTRTAFGSAYARAFEDGRRILFSLPMYHVFGYGEGLLAVCWVGGAIIPQVRFDPVATLAAVERHRATDALLIPTMSLAVLEAAATTKFDLSTLKSALASGGRAPERIWHAIRDVLGVEEITTGYGMTETTASTTVTRPDDPLERIMTTNGRMRDVGPAGDPTLQNRLVTYRVIDPETGAALPGGAMGELVARGPGLTRGYYNKPEASAAAFDAEGWLKTGDLGRIDEDGYIVLSGRTKESYRCGGELVLPTEIEDILTSHPDVMQAHVVPIPDERMGEVGVAFIVARDGATVDVEALRSLVSSRLARFKVPRHLLLLGAGDIPTTASGRARKFLLSQQALKILEAA